MNLETMQREGREGIKQQHNFEILFGAGSMAEQACESFLDQHTAATWKAALNSILESGLLEETGNRAGKYGMCEKSTKAHNTLARAIKELISNMNGEVTKPLYGKIKL